MSAGASWTDKTRQPRQVRWGQFFRVFILSATVFFTAVSATASARTYTNPVLYADFSDPDVVRVGHDYYLVASSFHLSPGIPVLHSRDLVHWRIIGHVLRRLSFAPEYDLPGDATLTDRAVRPSGGMRYGGGVWAPSIRFHHGLFYVYWPTPDEGVFMSTARNPAGPWSAPVAVIAQAGLEDPSPFWDDNGQAWLVHSKVGAGPIVLRRMSADGTRALDAGATIIEDRTALPVLEGPKLYQRDNWFYIWAPIGGVMRGPQVVFRSRTIEGPYEHRVVLEQGGSALAGPHQGAYVETPSGQGWFLHFNATGAFGRIVYLEPVRWTPDGWPIVGSQIEGRQSGEPVTSFVTPDAPKSTTRLQDSDEFSSIRLGLQWQWNHNPDDARWSLSARRGFLRLIAGRADHLVAARNTLTQMLQGPAMRVTTRIDVTGMLDGQRAGLALFGYQPTWIGVVQEGGARRVVFASAGVETPGPALAAQSIELRVDVSADQTARYAYSFDRGRSFQSFGDTVALPRFQPWWTAVRPSLFNFTHATPGGSIDVDWFRVDHSLGDHS